MIDDPKTFDERLTAVAQCTEAYGFDFPAVVDDMLDSTAIQYAAWPERLFVIDDHGRVAYEGGQGPMEFHVRKGEAAWNAEGVDESLEAFLESL